MYWLSRLRLYKINLISTVIFFTAYLNCANAQNTNSDTLTTYAIVYEGDTMEAKTLSSVDLFSRISNANKYDRAKWTRLRNAIIVTYPYAMRSGSILNEMNIRLTDIKEKPQRKIYIKSKEKDLKKEFTDPLSNLSIYQGKVLMKLINRQTGNNCYEIIKEYKGAFTARFYQTVAFFFSGNLKQPFDAQDEDKEMEMIVREVCQTYGFNYAAYRSM